MRRTIGITLTLWLAGGALLHAADWKAGASSVKITPTTPIWMAGYASRTHPSEGTIQDLHARALAIEDREGQRALLVTADLLGFTADFVERVAGRIQERHGISRSRILFNASHTHSGPALSGVLDVAYRMTPEQRADVDAYTRLLEDKILALAEQALAKLVPANLYHGRTRAEFAVNRRARTDRGFVIGVNRSGPVDHDVPFLVVDDERGQLLSIVFGYACHNTTVQGDGYEFNGDYAGWAQQWLEKRHPGAVAMYVAGTGADANPYPRGTVAFAQEHGETLAKRVHQSLTGPLTRLTGPLRAVFSTVTLEFSRVPSREELQKILDDKDADVFRKRHAELYMKRLERDGQLSARYEYPLQIWKFGRDVTMVVMGGEVVVDYALRLRRELPSEKLWVLGYSNDVACYIPSRRILAEGGYEAEQSMIYYGQPSPFAPTVEDRIVKKIQEMVRSLNAAR